MEVKIIDQKFQDIKNRLKDQGSETSTQKIIQFNKDFCIESVSPFDKRDQNEQFQSTLIGASSKYKSDFSDKKVLSEINNNSLQNENNYEFSRKSIEKQGKENHNRLASYTSSVKQVSVISENAEYQKNNDDDHVSVKNQQSENSKLSSTYVIYPQKEDTHSNSSLFKVQRDVPNKFKNHAHSRSNSRRDGMLSFSNNEENIRYNYMNEPQSLFKDEDSKQFLSETDKFSQFQHSQIMKISKILSQDEIQVLDKDAKKEYILFLKHEINQELKQEFRFKQMQEEVQLLNKNYRLEKELQQTEQDNRKLQIWILEDKIQQIEQEYQSKINEKNIFDSQAQELKEKIVQTNSSYQDKENLINQTKMQIENEKNYQIQENEKNKNLLDEQQDLKNELEKEKEFLKQQIQLQNESQETFDNYQHLQLEKEREIENLQQLLQQKETKIFGCKKDMRRIQDDIIEANEIKSTIKEEQDMYETQLCFLKKQKLIFERDTENLKKKKKFEEEFIHYGDKNNNHLFEQIKQNRNYFESQKDCKNQVDKEIIDFKKTIELASRQSLLVQKYIEQIEQNINQIIEVTKQGDEIFKNQDHYEQIRLTLFKLLQKNDPISNDYNRSNEQLQISKNQNSQSLKSNKLVDQKSINITKGSNHTRSRSNIENQYSIANIKESFSRQHEPQNFDENQNEEELLTKRILSDRAVSPIDIEKQKCFGFMGLGKSLNEGEKQIYNSEQDDQISQKTEDVAENQIHEKNDQKCKQNHQILNLNNLEKLSKIASQQKLQSPFTIRSMLTSQNGANQENKQIIKDNSQKNMDMPLQKNSVQPSLQQVSQKNYDLKSFLTKGTVVYENENPYEKLNENFQKDRLGLVSQIIDCSPLKQILPVQTFMKAQQKQKTLKKQTKSKDEKMQQKYFIDDIENNKFLEIQQKNELLKKGEIKQIIYLNDDFFNQKISEKPAKQIKIIKNKNNFSQNHQKGFGDNFQSLRERQFHNLQNNQPDLYFKNEAHYVQSENQKKKGMQYQTFQSRQEYEDFIDFQKQFCSSNTDFKDFKNQKEYVYVKAEPFKKKLNYDLNSQEQFFNLQSDISNAQKLFNGSKNTQSKFSDKTNEKYVVFQEMRQSQSGLFSQHHQRDHSNASIKKQITSQVFSSKKLVTDSKIDSFREKPPVYNQLSKKVLSSSQVENQYKKETQKCEQIKVAPLRKSITKRRDDSFNVSRKSDPQSINNLSSSHFSSINPHMFKFYSRKNTPNYDQISIQSQQPIPIPPIQTQKTSIIQQLQNNDDNLSKYNNLYDKFLNKEIVNSQLSTRSHYVAKPKNDLHKQSYYEVASYDNENGKVNSEYLKRKSFPINDGRMEIQSSKDNNITFKNSNSNHSFNKFNVNNPVSTIQTYQSQIKSLNPINLNLKSNFAKKNLENYCAPKTENKVDKKNIFSQRTENKSQVSNQYENTSNQLYKKQTYNHFGLKGNIQTQSQSSIQNNSYQQDIQKQDHEFSLMHKDQNFKQYEPPCNNINIKHQIENYDQYFKISSPEQKKNNQTIQAFTPYYQNNITQSHFASIEQQIADKAYPSISKCPITINDQIESKQNNYTSNQPFVKTQLQFKSNFAKTKFDQIQESQKIYEAYQNNNQSQKTPIKEAKSYKSSPSGVQNSRQSKLSQFLKPNTCQNDDNSNYKIEQKSQNQSQLEKMQQELKILQAQIGEGIVSQSANSPKEPKSVLVGNLKKREIMENDLCFDRSDLYGEHIDINSQRHQVGPGIYFLIKDQTQSYQNIGEFSRKDSQSDITTKTYQTKQIQDQQYIMQDQNIKVTAGSIAGRSVNNTYIELTDKRNLQNTVEELSEEQLRSQSDEKYSNYDNDQDNTYLSLKDQADIISQLRTSKNKF